MVDILNMSLLLEKLKLKYQPFEPAILCDSAQREDGDSREACKQAREWQCARLPFSQSSVTNIYRRR